MIKIRLQALLLGMLSLGSVSAARAQDLVQIWEAARQNDPQGQVLRAAHAVGGTQAQLAKAMWHPQVALNTTVGFGSAQTQMSGAQFAMPGGAAQNGASFATSVDGGTVTRWGVSLRQVLYSPQRTAQSAQLELATQAAEETWRWMQQEWMLQTAQRYFDGVVAQERLKLVQQQRLAIDRALAEAKDRFDLGDAPVTDAHEAQARALALAAEVIAAADGLRESQQVLADATQLPVAGMTLRTPSPELRGFQVDALDEWLQRADGNHPMLKGLQQQLGMAQQEVQKYQRMSSPALDLVVQSGRDRLSGSGDFGSASNTQTQHMVGLSLNLPLYAGGVRQAKLQEALHAVDKAQAELARARQQVGRMTRATWQRLHSSTSRLSALDAAVLASRERLDATLLAHQVGARTTLDVLNAQNEVQAMALAALRERVDVLLAQLRLQALSGSLDVASLQAVNARLTVSPLP